jgi:hypothetical protein
MPRAPPNATITDVKTTTTLVRMAVARLASILVNPSFARIAVRAAKVADKERPE